MQNATKELNKPNKQKHIKILNFTQKNAQGDPCEFSNLKMQPWKYFWRFWKFHARTHDENTRLPEPHSNKDKSNSLQSKHV